MTHHSYTIVRGTVLVAFALSATGWFLVRCLKRSDDPARLIFKQILTAPGMGWFTRLSVAEITQIERFTPPCMGQGEVRPLGPGS